MPKSTSSLSSRPEAPPEVDLPADYVARQCKRCGVWSTARARYDQNRSREQAWSVLTAWGRGTLHQPQGVHCLICKKAGHLGKSSRKRVPATCASDMRRVYQCAPGTCTRRTGHAYQGPVPEFDVTCARRTGRAYQNLP